MIAKRSFLAAAVAYPLLGATVITLLIYPFAVMFYRFGDVEYANDLMFDVVLDMWVLMIGLSVLFTGLIAISTVKKWGLQQHSRE